MGLTCWDIGFQDIEIEGSRLCRVWRFSVQGFRTRGQGLRMLPLPGIQKSNKNHKVGISRSPGLSRVYGLRGLVVGFTVAVIWVSRLRMDGTNDSRV